MFLIYITKIQRIYQIRNFLGNYFIKNESFLLLFLKYLSQLIKPAQMLRFIVFLPSIEDILIDEVLVRINQAFVSNI